MKRIRCTMVAACVLASLIGLARAGTPGDNATPPPHTPTDTTPEPITIDPDARAEELYNQGVERYRAGDIRSAERLLSASLENADDALAGRARYNLGNCHYARALQHVNKQDRSAAIAELQTASTLYREALADTPHDTDARANIELAQMLIHQLKQQAQQKQQQQQNKQQNASQDKQKQNNQSSEDKSSGQKDQPQNKQQTKQDSQNPQDKQNPSGQDSKPSSKNKQDPSSQKPSARTEKKQQDEPSQDRARQKQTPQSQPADSQQQPKPSDTDGSKQPGDESRRDLVPSSSTKPSQEDHRQTGSGGSAGPGEPVDSRDVRKLSKDEASRLLQSVRDRHLRRRIENFRRQQVRQPPVEKDW